MSNQAASQQVEETAPEEVDQFVAILNGMNARIHELMRAYEVSSHAINRLEQFTFSLIKLNVDSGTCTYEDLFTLARKVQSEKTLFDFFGITEEELKNYMDPASTEEVTTEENNT